MARQFNRKVEVTIGDGSNALKLSSDLRVTFEIQKDLLGYPNLCELSIYNLSKSTRAKIENEFEKVIVSAGYEGNVQTIFVGDIRNATSLKSGADWVTRIFAGDGNRDINDSFTNIAFAEGTNVGEMIQKILDDLKNTASDVFTEIGLTDEETVGSTTLSGDTSRMLDDLADQYNFDWSIQNGVAQIIPRNSYISRAIVLSQESGMIGAPVITEIGIDAKSLLAPAAVPGRLIQIEASTADINLGNLLFRPVTVTNASGFYKILKLTHSGDNYGNAWTTSYTGQRISNMTPIALG